MGHHGLRLEYRGPCRAGDGGEIHSQADDPPSDRRHRVSGQSQESAGAGEREAARAAQAGRGAQECSQAGGGAAASARQHAAAAGQQCTAQWARGDGRATRFWYFDGGRCRQGAESRCPPGDWGSRVGAASGGGAEKKVRAAAPKPSAFADGCAEEPTKPKSIDRAQPQYTDDARSANIEGVVSVEFRIGPDGQVIDARIVKGLGHGLDEAALAAAKRWRFNPSTRCGKPVEAKHVVNMRSAWRMIVRIPAIAALVALGDPIRPTGRVGADGCPQRNPDA